MDRRRLKKMAKESLQSKRAGALLVASVLVSFLGLTDALLYALSGLDRLIDKIAYAAQVTPEVTFNDVLSLFQPPSPVALFFMAALGLYRVAARFCFKGVCLKIARRGNPTLRAFLDGLSQFFKCVALCLVRLLLVLLGTAFFIAPGVYLWYGFRLSDFLLLDNPRWGVFKCLRGSMRLMRGRRRELFRLDLSFLGWRLVDLLVYYQFSMWLFSIWLAPYAGVTYAGYYLELAAPERSA